MKNQTITQEIRAMPNSKTLTKIQAAIKFGMQSKNCQNHGICEITMRHENEQPCTTCCQAILIYDEKNNSLLINFLKVSISLLSQKKYFANNTFLMEEDYFLNDTINPILTQSQEKTKLQEGLYVVKNTREYLSVLFTTVKDKSEKQKKHFENSLQPFLVVHYG